MALSQIRRLVLASLLERPDDSHTPAALAARTGAPERLVALVLGELARQGLLEASGDTYSVPDPVELALHAVGMGLDPRRVAESLDWRHFERFVARALAEYDYIVARNLRLKPPGGVEVDVLGVGRFYGLAIDCKHWSPRTTSPSKLVEAARRHRARIDILASRWAETGLAEPGEGLVGVMVTLTDPGVRSLEGVGVVPVSVFHDFASRVEYYVDELGLHVARPPG